MAAKPKVDTSTPNASARGAGQFAINAFKRTSPSTMMRVFKVKSAP